MQGDHGFADPAGQRDPSHGVTHVIRARAVVVVGVGVGSATGAKRGDDDGSVAVVGRIQLLAVDPLGEVPVDPAVVVPQELGTGREAGRDDLGAPAGLVAGKVAL